MVSALVQSLRTYLTALPSPVTYADAARGIEAPTINALTQALELMMEQDAAAGRPLLAAMVISRTHALPNRGFFDLARTLGYVVEDEADFHSAQLAALGKLIAKP